MRVRIKFPLIVATLFFKLAWGVLGTSSLAFMGQPHSGVITPPGDFLLAEASQTKNSAYWICTREGLSEAEGWVLKELYSLIPGSPRPSVVEIRRHVRTAIEALGGRIAFEGRCVEMDDTGDPRASHVILTGLLPTAWGDLHMEVWPWEEGEALHCQITFILENPRPSP